MTFRRGAIGPLAEAVRQAATREVEVAQFESFARQMRDRAIVSVRSFSCARLNIDVVALDELCWINSPDDLRLAGVDGDF